MGKKFLGIFFKNNIYHYIKKYICIWLLVAISFCYSIKILAEESSSTAKGKPDQDGFESRIAKPEPDFFFSGSSSELKGFYFGVGFRSVSLLFTDDLTISDSDGTANGIGTNLGYFWEKQALEYERQISIIDLKETLSYETKTGQKLEVIQNNFWYIIYPKISMKIYLHYGAGIQFTRTRFAATDIIKSYEDEIAMGAETGLSYFLMSNLKLSYRFSLGRQMPFLKTSGSSTFLKQSLHHTIFLNYYIPL